MKELLERKSSDLELSELKQWSIVWVDLPLQEGSSIQGGRRPAIVISNDKANKYSPVINIITITSRINKKRSLPTHLFLNENAAKSVGLSKASIIQGESLLATMKTNVVGYIGTIVDNEMKKAVKRIIEIQLGLLY